MFQFQMKEILKHPQKSISYNAVFTKDSPFSTYDRRISIMRIFMEMYALFRHKKAVLEKRFRK